MKKSIAVVLIIMVALLFVMVGCWEPDLDRPSLTRHIAFEVMGDSNNVTINGEEGIDLTAGPYEKTVKIIAYKINEDDPFFTEWVFPSVRLSVTDFSGAYTAVNCEIWDEKTGQVEADGVIVDPFESITVEYKPALRP